MANKTDGERLERVETNLENLNKLVEAQSVTLNEIKDAQILALATNASKEYVDNKIASVELKLENTKRKTAFQTTLTGVLSAAFGVVMTILIQSYLTK